MKTLKKFLSVVLSVMMVAAFVPMISASALTGRFFVLEGEQYHYSGAPLVFDENTPDTINEEQKWAWDQETLTLTLNGVNLTHGNLSGCIEFKNPADPATVYTINFKGTNTLSRNIIGNYNTNFIFKGEEDAVLNINDPDMMCIYGSEITFESGTVNLKSLVWGDKKITLNGGTLNIDTRDDSSAKIRGLVTLSDGLIEINGGAYNFYSIITSSNEPAAIYVNNEDRENCTDYGIKINGGDIYLENCIGIAALYKSVYVDNYGKGSIEFKDVPIAFLVNCGANAGEFYIKSVDMTANNVDTPSDIIDKLSKVHNNVTKKIGDADYTRVDAALESIPNELTGVSLGNIMALIEAKNAVNYNLDCFEQAKVDEMAEKLEKVVAKILDEVPEEPSDPVDPPAEDPGDEEVSWFVKLIRAIAGIFKTVFNFLFGWIGK